MFREKKRKGTEIHLNRIKQKQNAVGGKCSLPPPLRLSADSVFFLIPPLVK